MRNLNLSDWANVAEIVASIVIVASLIYVGMEVNQNTKALQNDSAQSVMEMLAAQQNILATDPEFHRVFSLGENAPAELSEEEWSRFTQFNFTRIGSWEYLYVGMKNNSISLVIWSSFDPYFRGFICREGNRRWFNENRAAHAPQFISYLEEDVLPSCQPD